MKIKKDNRSWKVVLTFDNEKCPFLFFPADYHGCELFKADDIKECTLENCKYLSCLLPKQVKVLE